MKIKIGDCGSSTITSASACGIKLANSCGSNTTVSSSCSSEPIHISVCQQGPPGPPGSGSGGYVYVTDVTSTSGNVGDKVYLPDTVPSDIIVTQVSSDTETVTIHFMAEGGTVYSPTITVDGIVCTNLQQYPNDRRLFFGSVDVVVNSSRDVSVVSSTGIETSVLINRAAAGPEILNVRFINGYPDIQTEVKAGDHFDIQVDFNPAGSEPTHLEILDYGACSAMVIDLSTTSLSWGTTHTVIVQTVIDSTSINTQALPMRCIAKNSLGTYGAYVDTNNSGGNVDGQHLVNCNDVVPTFTDNGVTYPMGQTAFKNNEQGSQSTTVHNFSDLLYSSDNNDFSISDNSIYSENKTIICQNPEHYNVSSNNFKIVANRVQNGTQSIFNKNIRVADIAPVVTVTQPNARLRSSNIGETYTITATPNQELMSTFNLTIPVSGTWQGSGFVGGPLIYTQDILITDNDNKGTAAWDWDGTIPLNRAGIPATISGSEVVAGFIARTLTIAAWPNRQVDIGTTVVNVNNLIVENLSKGGSGPNGGTIFSYSNVIDNALDEYTILDNSDNVDPNGNVWYNKDLNNAVSNTTGTAKIIIEEI